MKLALFVATALLIPLTGGYAQDRNTVPDPSSVPGAEAASASPSPSPAVAPTATPAHHSLFGRMLHPFSSGSKPDVGPNYKEAKLHGLTLAIEIAQQPVKLSEVRQLDVRAILTNHGKKGIELDFGTDQRIEIYLMGSTDTVLTRWSENHAINSQPGIVLINPGEHIEYNEKIATRELARDKVYLAEVFFPQYPELRARQKFMTAP